MEDLPSSDGSAGGQVRCSRNDGKNWRCNQLALPGSRHCSKHSRSVQATAARKRPANDGPVPAKACDEKSMPKPVEDERPAKCFKALKSRWLSAYAKEQEQQRLLEEQRLLEVRATSNVAAAAAGAAAADEREAKQLVSGEPAAADPPTSVASADTRLEPAAAPAALEIVPKAEPQPLNAEPLADSAAQTASDREGGSAPKRASGDGSETKGGVSPPSATHTEAQPNRGRKREEARLPKLQHLLPLKQRLASMAADAKHAGERAARATADAEPPGRSLQPLGTTHDTHVEQPRQADEGRGVLREDKGDGNQAKAAAPSSKDNGGAAPHVAPPHHSAKQEPVGPSHDSVEKPRDQDMKREAGLLSGCKPKHFPLSGGSEGGNATKEPKLEGGDPRTGDAGEASFRREQREQPKRDHAETSWKEQAGAERREHGGGVRKDHRVPSRKDHVEGGRKEQREAGRKAHGEQDSKDRVDKGLEEPAGKHSRASSPPRTPMEEAKATMAGDSGSKEDTAAAPSGDDPLPGKARDIPASKDGSSRGAKGPSDDSNRKPSSPPGPAKAEVKCELEGSALTHTVDLSKFSNAGSLLKQLRSMFGCNLEETPSLSLVYQDRHGDWMLLQSGEPWPLVVQVARKLLLTSRPVVLGGAKATAAHHKASHAEQ
eukprot:CAMPEP_0117677732 /NCGR_PEP_ID=MMETSP0804-20121206/16901_1 /TAXON_ID=1074897 /ORGANISM="Tetraselmis astigmatica, Strain CCMP880" /LENGTH=658 /DNA_ID=CAMNT_0005487033 /DNA_START=200 /DNA_END=2176 /DNA_ORIENTATION=+